jgi:acetyl-CoA decarbonylase/synthase complex subunit gamma
MALTGLQIYKYLPKTNCKECGFPTCLAFAMKLATKGAELSACPHVTNEAREALESAAAPPIRLISFGSDGRKIEVGNEVVLFRHDKTFYHQPGLVVRLKDTMPADQIQALAARVAGYSVDRVGIKLALDGLAVENASGDKAKFLETLRLVQGKAGQVPLILIASNPDVIDAALQVTGTSKPLIYAATATNWSKMAELAKKYGAPLAVHAPQGLDALADLTQKVAEAGVADIVIDPGARGMLESLQTLTQLRRLALKKNFRPLGYPIITFPAEGAETAAEEMAIAAQQIQKYAGVVVLDTFAPELVYPLLTLRMNIYTDPQKPIQVEPKLYEIGAPTADSPVLVTTNFSLTYFSIVGDVEGSRVPTWLVVTDSEGMSVLTAWAAGKFDAEKIAKSLKANGIDEKVNHRRVIIPGCVATLSGELEDQLPDWEIMVGPRESVDISSYFKRTWNKSC